LTNFLGSADFEDFSCSVEGYGDICRWIKVVKGKNQGAYGAPDTGLTPD